MDKVLFLSKFEEAMAQDLRTDTNNLVCLCTAVTAMLCFSCILICFIYSKSCNRI